MPSKHMNAHGKAIAESAAGESPWAYGSIGKDPGITLETFLKNLMVGLIATKRADFETCIQDEDILTVVDRNRRNRFGFLPVIELATEGAGTRGRIVG
jgi:hypothetical protein